MTSNRVLFISNLPFSEEDGNDGKTFLSLFSEFQNETVIQLFFNNTSGTPAFFNRCYRLTDIDIIKNKISLFTHKLDGKVEQTFASNSKALKVKKRFFLTETLKKIIRNFVFAGVKITEIESFKIWIEENKPTTIFFIGTNYNYSYKILQDISKKYNLPYFIYFNDDLFIHKKGTNFITRFLQKRFIIKSVDIVKGASELFVISNKMKEEYESYFGKRCNVLFNAVNKGVLPIPKKEFGQIVIFRYFGWLHTDRSSSLRYLGECLKYINENSAYRCILEVFSLTNPVGKIKSNLNLDSIRICEPLSGSEFLEKRQMSDFLVHAESFSPDGMQITRLSISTKIPEYLLSNRCIVAIGPPELASIEIIKENNLGIAITKTNKLKQNALEILNVIENNSIYQQYCENSQSYYDKEFDARKMRKVLKEKLLN